MQTPLELEPIKNLHNVYIDYNCMDTNKKIK